MSTFSIKLGDLLAKPYNLPYKLEEPKMEIKSNETVVKVIKAKEKPIHKEINDKEKEITHKKAREVPMTAKGVNIQDQFLNHMRRDKVSVAIHLLDGKEIQGHIKSFDNFCIQLESSGDILIYKHGISSIVPSNVSDYTKKD